MPTTNPFQRTADSQYDVHLAMKTFVLLHAHKKWGNVRIKKIIYRGRAPWSRMDVVFQTFADARETQSEIGEFLEHYAPDGIGKFIADNFLVKVDELYGETYIYEIQNTP